MRRALLLLPLGVSAAVGCGPSAGPGTPPPAVPAPQSTAGWKQVDGPEFANWRRFPVGTAVVRTAVTTVGDNSTTSVQTFTLKGTSDAEVSVERQNTTTRSDGTYHKVNDPDARTYAARISVHPALDPNDFHKPDRAAKETGTEKVAVLGREYDCTRYEWTNPTEAGPMAVTVWVTDELPGRIAKQVMTVAAINSTTVEQVTAVRKPE